MYMFRTLFKGTHIKQFYRKFSEKKMPTFSIAWSQKDGINIEKEKNPDWKATKGNGKSIYDCDDELWCTTENPLSDEWKEANERED